MAARLTPSKGGKPDKLARDALMLELHQEAVDAEGQMTKRLRLVARKVVDRAIDGDMVAAKEIFDRLDGKSAQPLVGGDEGDTPVKLVVTWLTTTQS